MQGRLSGDQLLLSGGADQPSTRAKGPLQGKTHGRSVHLRGSDGQISILENLAGRSKCMYQGEQIRGSKFVMTVYTSQLEARYPLLHARVLTGEGSVFFY